MDPAVALETRELARHRNINDTIALGDSPVQQFYEGAVVLITGGSGFLGKQLVEKLLRSCAIKKIFLVLRSNKHGSAKERLKKTLSDPVYDYLRKTQPNFEDKVVPVSGDMTHPRLGISDNERRIIAEEVTIIFHSAAIVSFNEPLKKATMTNVHGTREMIFLAKECKNLKSFVHVSTAYSPATVERAEKEVLEQFYDTPISPEVLVRLVEEMDEASLEEIAPRLMKGWPNTYSFTKAVAEGAFRTIAADLPTCIVRPAIVICAYREPLPGWIDRSAVFGASGLVVGVGVGVLHVLYGDTNIKVDLVPVDLVNNAAIVAARETVERRARGLTDTKIYTVCIDRNPINFGTVIDLMIKEGKKIPTIKSIYYAYTFVINNPLLYNLMYFFFHTLPGYFADGILLLCGKKAMLTNVYRKAYKQSSVIHYFATHNWKFGDSNLLELYERLSPADQVIYNCDIACIDWPLCTLLWCIGCRKYIIKDGLKDTEKAISRQFLFRILNYICVTLYAYLIYKCICIVFNIVNSLGNVM